MLNSLPPLARRLLTLVGLVLVIALSFRSQVDVYLSKTNFLAMLRAMSINGIVAIGLTFVIVTRKFDLSLAGIASLSAMTLGFTMAASNSLWMTIVASVAMGTAIGLVNGLLVGKGRLPDVVTTIATGSIAYGLAFAFNGGADYSKNFFSSGLVTMNFKTVLGLQIPVFTLLIVAVFSACLLHATRYGNSLFATGENPVAARFSGIREWRILALAFSICGMMIGVAMILHVSGVGSSRVTAGSQILLPAYTAVYLGSALLGRASIGATLGGVVVMTMLLNGFTLMSIPYYYSDAVVSLILILAITVFDPTIFRRLQENLKRVTSRKAV